MWIYGKEADIRGLENVPTERGIENSKGGVYETVNSYFQARDILDR